MEYTQLGYAQARVGLNKIDTLEDSKCLRHCNVREQLVLYTDLTVACSHLGPSESMTFKPISLRRVASVVK